MKAMREQTKADTIGAKKRLLALMLTVIAANGDPCIEE
jgi:hypothetical protein